MLITKTCIGCLQQFSFEVDDNDYNAWMGGELVQNAFPYINPGLRELLISGICNTCFNSMYDDDDDDDDDYDESVESIDWDDGEC